MEDVMDVNEVEKVLVRERERGKESRSFEMECCIFKIPNEVSMHNDKAYLPQAFSIGPFHCSNPRTVATHTIKLRYFDDLLSENDVTPRDLIEAVNKDYDRALRHYSRRVDNMSREEFIKVLVLDGCFLIELFLKNKFLEYQEAEEPDPIFSVPRLRQQLNHDLVLLENQLPWMVLETLFYETVSKHRPEYVTLVDIILEFFAPLLFDVTHFEFTESDDFNPDRVKHILDLLRQKSLSSLPEDESMANLYWPDARFDPVMHSATALEESGIKIQFVNYKPGSIFNVKFEAGVLIIPQVILHDTTDTLFRNLVALELYCPDYDLKVTSYVKLFDDLVQTTADMKLLWDKKVVHSTLRLDKATLIFNQTSDGNLDVKRNYYYQLIQDLDEYRRQKRKYYMRRWRVYRRELKLVYFSHPWASISTFAASLVVFLTLFQTVLAVLSYVKDSNESCPCLSGNQP